MSSSHSSSCTDDSSKVGSKKREEVVCRIMCVSLVLQLSCTSAKNGLTAYCDRLDCCSSGSSLQQWQQQQQMCPPPSRPGLVSRV